MLKNNVFLSLFNSRSLFQISYVIAAFVPRFYKTNCSLQILKILHNFNPKDGWGGQLPSGLISQVETLLKSKRPNESRKHELQTPATTDFPINIPFLHNNQSLNKVIIPKSLYNPCLRILEEKDLV